MHPKKKNRNKASKVEHFNLSPCIKKSKERKETKIVDDKIIFCYLQDQNKWMWYDRKDNSSFATSSSSEDSLLFGINTFDFRSLCNA